MCIRPVCVCVHCIVFPLVSCCHQERDDEEEKKRTKQGETATVGATASRGGIRTREQSMEVSTQSRPQSRGANLQQRRRRRSSQ